MQHKYKRRKLNWWSNKWGLLHKTWLLGGDRGKDEFYIKKTVLEALDLQGTRVNTIHVSKKF